MCTEILLLQLASCHWPVFIMFSSFIFLVVSLTSIFFSLPINSGRFLSLKSLVAETILFLIASKVSKTRLVFLFILLAYSDLLFSVSSVYVPNQHYGVVMSISLCFCAPIFLFLLPFDFMDIFAHLSSQGEPLWSIVLGFIVRYVVVLARQLTFSARTVFNLVAGHLLRSLFSFLYVLLPPALPFTGLLLAALFTLELCVSFLQAYLLVDLLSLRILSVLDPLD